MTRPIWVTPDILKWPWLAATTTVYAEDGWRRPYSHWNHADQLLVNADSEFVRTDIITTLKRGIDHRVRALMGLYDLRGLPLRDKPSEQLELLGYVGLVRPRMVQRLLTIRNLVEHADAPPPSKEECEVFAEFAWYFIRSTDRVARASVDTIDVELGDINQHESLPYPYRIELALGPDVGWIPRVSGRFKKEWVSATAQPGWLQTQASRIETGAELIAEARGSHETDYRLVEVIVDPSDTFLKGELRGPGDSLLAMYRRYFELT
jgi:hypothetical protein